MAGRIAKYLDTSLAMLKVVSAPRVISNCLPISTISMSLVGLESRSTMFPASRAAWVPVFMATPEYRHPSRARGRRIVGAVAAHGNELALALLVADQPQLFFGRGLGEEIVDAGFGCNRRRGQRVI